MAMSYTDYFVLILMTIFLIVGVFQFYFWCQRHVFHPKYRLTIFIDSWFGYEPGWVWVYSGLYFPVIILDIFTVKDMRQYIYFALSFFILLAMQMTFFLLFPVESPAEWRKKVKGKTISEKFLRFVMKIDADTNCFPSMHVSIATLTALHINSNAPQLGLWVFLFPVLIGLSSLYTKRHYFLDIIPGAFLGWVAFQIYKVVYA